MPASAFDPLTDRAFLAWTREVCEQLQLEPGRAEESNDFLAFLGKHFTLNGELPADHLAPLVQQRRIDVSTRWARRLFDRARRETGLGIEEALWSEPPGHREPTGLTQVGNTTILAVREPDIACETGDAVQGYVMDRYRTVWPVCPGHGLGYHAVLVGGAPQWECSSGAHRVPMPGEHHR
ncbi:hypothetical protein ACIQ9E_01165 [Streptomyces sp. NPDC094448]|uniref:hypothetical protein n=1 Tax=Streptomyces sp. NPDC094448 TaxID=3366063 RepID=UPI003804EC5A